MKNRLPLISSLLLLPILTLNNAIAEEGIIPKLIEYDVEVIIFEDAHARYINSEYWHDNADSSVPESEAAEAPENLGNLSINKINATSFKTIKPVILNQEYKRINYSKEYNVLFYGSWRQTGLDSKKAFEINIEELDNRHKTNSENSITGNFKLVLARYLHIYGDMQYQRKQADTKTEDPVTNIEPSDTASNSSWVNTGESATIENLPYPINIHRRMRSKELHYIDHPLVGMLIQINPVVVSEEETAEKSAAQ